MKRRNRQANVRGSTLRCGRLRVLLDNSRCMAQHAVSRERVPAVTTAPATFVLSATAPLFEAKDVEGFPSRLAETAAAVLGTRQTFAILCDRLTGRPDLA